MVFAALKIAHSMLQFRIIPHDQFFLAQLQGLVSPQAWEKVLQELEDAIRDGTADRMLLQLGGLVGWLGTPERRAVGGHMAVHLARMKKVALVIQAGKITGVVESEAKRNGLNLRLFSNYEEAASWVVS